MSKPFDDNVCNRLNSVDPSDGLAGYQKRFMGSSASILSWISVAEYGWALMVGAILQTGIDN